MVTIGKVELLVITLSIFVILKDIWFIDFRASQHFTFQNDIFSTFEEFILNHAKYILETIISLMCVRKILLFSICQMEFASALEMYYMSQSWLNFVF
jgi:hypothetical protein